MDLESGNFTHHNLQPDKTHLSLSDLHLTSGNPTQPSSPVLLEPTFSDILAESRKILDEASSYEVVVAQLVGGACL